MPRLPVEDHEEPFEVSRLELNLPVLILSLVRKSSRGQALDWVGGREFSPLLLLQGDYCGGQEEGS